MGYTHYWRRTRSFERAQFEKVKTDFERAMPVLARRGVPLAGPVGEGEPELSAEEICFNGARTCGHVRREIGLTWPAPDASGICLAYKEGRKGDTDIGGQWLGGRLVHARTCDGDCSYESFDLPLVAEFSNWQEPDEQGRYLAFCKTAYRPYDLAVQMCLVIAAHHLGAAIAVSSDGAMEDWQNAISLCQEELGYGDGFQLA